VTKLTNVSIDYLDLFASNSFLIFWIIYSVVSNCSEKDSADLHFSLLSSMKNFCEEVSHEMQMFPDGGSTSKNEMHYAAHVF